MIEPTQNEISIIKQLLPDDKDLELKLQKLQEYVELVLQENNKHNIIGRSTVKNIWIRHVIDSLQLSLYINSNDINVVDFGSGAGFPAIILSIVTKNHFFLIEKSPVKAKFLSNVINTLGLNNARVINSFITNNNLTFLPKNSIIIARAFKSISEILNIVASTELNKIILLKGKKWKEEIDKVPKNILKKWHFEAKNSVFNESVILIINRQN